MARQPRQFMRQGVGDLPTRAAVLAYTGARGEPVFDGDTLRMQDGQTPGGIPLLTSTSDISAAKVGVNKDALRDFADVVSDVINIKSMLVGVGKGDENIDTAALKKALLRATAIPGSTILLPAAPYRFRVTPRTFGFRLPSGTTLRGDGSRTIIRWNDAEASVDGSNELFLFGPADGTTRTSNILFRDFTVIGSCDTSHYGRAYPFLLTQIDGLTITGVTVSYSRTFSLGGRQCTDVSIDNNKLEYGGADGINFSTCTNIAVRSNQIEHINDDSIAISSAENDPWKVRRNIVVTDNRIFDAPGINIIGARHAVISDNQLDTVRSHGISITTAPPGGGRTEGQASMIAVSVTDNVITNLINRDAIDNLSPGSGIFGIRILGSSARPGNHPSTPGEPDPATGKIKNPYYEILANSTSASVPTPGSYGILVANNIVSRTLPQTDGSDPRFTKWSDLGQGQIWTAEGWKDPAVSDAHMRGLSIYLEGGVLRDVLATGNVLRGMNSGLVFSNGERFDNVAFRGNTVSDMTGAGVVITTNAKLCAYIDDNIFDIDPFLQSPKRGPNGTWAQSGAPYGILGVQGTYLFFRGNTFKNVNTLSLGGFSNPGYYWAENMAEADVVTFGPWSASNRGIGEIPESSARMRWVRVDSNPSSAAFGTILAIPAYS